MGKIYEAPAIGDKFGKWTVTSECFYTPDGRYRMVNIRCECGNEREASPWHLHNGRATMCRSCHNKINAKAWTTHGERASTLYKVWVGIKGRCLIRSNASYAKYGGMGISVCDEWRDRYEAFRDWALSNGFSDGLQIDRIDNAGNYTPSNCRWVTRSENCRNRNSSLFITAWNETKTAAAWK